MKRPATQEEMGHVVFSLDVSREHGTVARRSAKPKISFCFLFVFLSSRRMCLYAADCQCLAKRNHRKGQLARRCGLCPFLARDLFFPRKKTGEQFVLQHKRAASTKKNPKTDLRWGRAYFCVARPFPIKKGHGARFAAQTQTAIGRKNICQPIHQMGLKKNEGWGKQRNQQASVDALRSTKSWPWMRTMGQPDYGPFLATPNDGRAYVAFF
nr:hypothetical protein [Pandoravirus aubagnensis]